MKFSPALTVGLKRLGNSALISDDVFKKVLEGGFETLTGSAQTTDLSDILTSKADLVKESHGALMSLLLEVTREDISPKTVDSFLSDELKWSANRTKQLIESYTTRRGKLQAALSSIGAHPPHIVDANWRLDYYIKSSSSEHEGSPLFLVQLSTDSPGRQQIKFVCSLSELQDLVAKLKDALRSVERLSSST